MPASVDHPRPFLQRPWRSLDGPWDFAFDSGQIHRHPDDVEFDATITVPFAPETPAAGVGTGGNGADGYVQRSWYRRTVDADHRPKADLAAHVAATRDKLAD